MDRWVKGAESISRLTQKHCTYLYLTGCRFRTRRTEGLSIHTEQLTCAGLLICQLNSWNGLDFCNNETEIGLLREEITHSHFLQRITAHEEQNTSSQFTDLVTFVYFSCYSSLGFYQ